MNFEETIKKYINEPNTFVFVDQNVYSFWKDKLELNNVIIIESSEENKTLKTIEELYSKAMEIGANRASTFIGIGGGIITDMVGYLASTYMRGVKFKFIPTTLLAMVDAAIGGKNGVNFNGYKNMIGTINQPTDVLVYPEFLETLPIEEIYSAFGEILKYGIGFDKDIFNILESHTITEIINDKALLSEIIDRCIYIHS